MKKLILPAFALMVLAQWIVPIKTILDSEAVLKEGQVYRFKTRPIDPSDPFRGKYVTLNYEAERFETDTASGFSEDQSVYAVLKEDQNGYSTIKQLYSDLPEGEEHFLKTTVRYVWNESSDRQVVQLNFPFNRFYVEESKASDAEQAYWNAQQDSTRVSYAVIRIKNGQGMLENVMIDDRPILEIVREMNEKEQ